jgi:ABC-type glycerol-3-phosphate transport system substrate-binding protein
VTEQEFRFYDEVFHPRTGGPPAGPIFRQAFADYLAGKFDPQAVMQQFAAEKIRNQRRTQ